ncbi:Diaminopimelate epimerase-like protein [Peniophora sp. CONT]|nr:Diaminopimelate epimerase-like protein [Peniophora sp. CONT]
MAPLKLPFAILNAFSTELGGGNPAAVIITTPEEDAALTSEQRLSIARNLNQPMHMFITPKADAPNGFSVRWWTTVHENLLCGHATFAASGLLFSEQHGSPFFVPGADAIKSFNFNGVANSLEGAKVDDGKVEIALQASQLEELGREDARAVKLRAAVAAAVGADVGVIYLGAGAGPYKNYCLVELDVEDLGAVNVAYAALRTQKESGFGTNVFTARHKPAEREAGVAFETRMFAPSHGIDEDHVCGSAHGLLVPYWDRKLESKGQTMRSHQVSARGGDLWVRLDAEKGLVRLAGYVVKVAEGTIFA